MINTDNEETHYSTVQPNPDFSGLDPRTHLVSDLQKKVNYWFENAENLMNET